MSNPKPIGFLLPKALGRDESPHPVSTVPATLKSGGAVVAVSNTLPVKNKDGEMTLSLYNDNPVGDAEWAVQALRITSVFPEMGSNAPFMNELCKAVLRKKMTASQLEDAIDALIDTCRYPRFSIADVVSYDRSVKLYDYDAYCSMCCAGTPGDSFESVKVDGKCFFVKKVDLVNARNGMPR